MVLLWTTLTRMIIIYLLTTVIIACGSKTKVCCLDSAGTLTEMFKSMLGVKNVIPLARVTCFVLPWTILSVLWCPELFTATGVASHETNV